MSSSGAWVQFVSCMYSPIKKISVVHNLPDCHKECGIQFADWAEGKYEIFIHTQFFGWGLFSTGRACKKNTACGFGGRNLLRNNIKKGSHRGKFTVCVVMSGRFLTGPILLFGKVKSDRYLHELQNYFFSHLMTNDLPMYTQDGATWRRKYSTGSQQHVPAALPVGKTQCTLDRGLVRLRGQKSVVLLYNTHMIYIYIYIYIYIQSVPGGICQTSGGCSLC